MANAGVFVRMTGGKGPEEKENYRSARFILMRGKKMFAFFNEAHLVGIQPADGRAGRSDAFRCPLFLFLILLRVHEQFVHVGILRHLRLDFDEAGINAILIEQLRVNAGIGDASATKDKDMILIPQGREAGVARVDLSPENSGTQKDKGIGKAYYRKNLLMYGKIYGKNRLWTINNAPPAGAFQPGGCSANAPKRNAEEE